MRKGFSWLMGVFVMGLVILGGGVAFFFVQQNPNDASLNPAVTVPTPDSVSSLLQPPSVPAAPARDVVTSPPPLATQPIVTQLDVTSSPVTIETPTKIVPETTTVTSPKSDNVESVKEEPKKEVFVGEVLAGSLSPFLDFHETDFQAALKTNKLIVLYFYASWCPICRDEVANGTYPAFNELSSPNVIGFRVNYKDSQTDAAEVDLARQHGIAYQHTKVFLKGGVRIFKSPETWSKDRYLSEISKFVQ